jgi:CRISPR/Cas system-associated exonuclease Cas4 (RecB family)
MTDLKKLLVNKDGMGNEYMVYINKWHEWLREWKQKNDDERNETGHYFHASGLVDKYFCIVKAILEDMMPDESDVNSLSTLAIFKAGKDIHDKHQKFLQDKFDCIYIEKPLFSNFLQLTATPDAIIKFLGIPTIVEIKSMNCFKYDKTKTPPDNAQAQAQIYMYLYGVPKAIIICENKNNQDIKLFPLDFDLNSALTYITRRRAMLNCIKKNKIPLEKRYCKTSKQKAKQCKFNTLCWNEDMLNNFLEERKNR